MQNLVRTHPHRRSLRQIVLVSLVVLASSFVTWVSFKLDEPVRLAVVQAREKGWKKTDDFRFKTAVRRIGDWPWLMLAGAIGLGISWRLKNREWTRLVAAAMIASTIAGLLANASRLTTGRTPPRESPAISQGFYGPWREGRLTIGNPRFNSFPSGHTATAFGFAGVILFARPWLGVGAIAFASLIAWSSIMVGAHHLSDVVAAVCLSLVVAWFSFKWTREHGDALARTARIKLAELRRARRDHDLQDGKTSREDTATRNAKRCSLLRDPSQSERRT